MGGGGGYYGGLIMQPMHSIVISDCQNSIGQILQYTGERPSMTAQQLIQQSQISSMSQLQQYNPYLPGPIPTATPPEKLNQVKPKEGNMLSEVAKDMRGFVKEHKSMIYWVLVLFMLDHFFFQGSFKAKLKSMMDNLVGKIESKINDAKV